MSEENFDPEALAEFLRELLSQQNGLDPEQLAAAAGLANDPKALAELMRQLQQSLAATSKDVVNGVNWKLAIEQSRKFAAEGAFAVGDADRTAIAGAISIAELWLDESTSLPQLTTTPKLITRELWVGESLPLFQELSEPIASRMAEALTENLAQNMPEELSGMLAGAGGMLRSAGGTIFAMQLGQTLGKLSREVLSGGDLGLPFFTEQRAVFVPQNINEYSKDLEIEKDQLLIFLAIRELAHARLFKQSKWLRDSVVSQIINYASGITIDAERMSDLAEGFDFNDQDRLREALGNGELLSERTEDQKRALANIETTLALIEGWVEAVTDEASKRLPQSATLGEIQRRRRASASPAQATFSTLLGLELRPKRIREAAAMWQAVTAAVGAQKRDALWDHPDLMPSSEDIDNPAGLISKLRDTHDDAMDAELRKLLD
ncbi:MAG: zinc-dependent metalloprotease [Rhodoluna sp.]|nr:zinc-dependent metalloprotease [Rhodoluna sp.]